MSICNKDTGPVLGSGRVVTGCGSQVLNHIKDERVLDENTLPQNNHTSTDPNTHRTWTGERSVILSSMLRSPLMVHKNDEFHSDTSRERDDSECYFINYSFKFYLCLLQTKYLNWLMNKLTLLHSEPKYCFGPCGLPTGTPVSTHSPKTCS